MKTIKSLLRGCLPLVLTPLSLLAADQEYLSLPIHVSQGIFYFDPTVRLQDQQVELAWQTAPKPPKGLGYYAQYLFAFENDVVGYMGLQWDNQGKKAIFSVWDQPGQITALPEEGCKRFGHEGSGASCITPYNWPMHDLHTLHLFSLGTTSHGERWQVTVNNSSLSQPAVVGTLTLQNSKGFTGYGKLKTTSYATLEYYGSARMTCETLPVLAIRWQGPYANSRQLAAQSVKVNYPTMKGKSLDPPRGCPNVSVKVPSRNQLLLSAGGDTRQELQKGSKIRW
ncbi:MAG: hypothetical protein G8345_05865 [Magnetococcales bacterium]|nr:hypothetical protein [Magnetococcales bacterium]NGZ26395.1 hypothetical protein [Magnetococcales bacterium]